MTRNARLILDIINSSNEHLTAEQIYLTLKSNAAKAVLATVYNNLNAMHKQGLVRKVSVEGYPDKYDRTIPHDHLVCKQCGRLADVPLESLLPKLQAQLDVEILSYDLKVMYICSFCQEAEGH